MAVHKVPCPQCSAVLKSAKGMPEGAAVKCPQCKHSFRVPAPVAVGVAASPPPGGPPRTLANQYVTTAPPAAPQLTPAAPSVELPASANRNLRLGLVLGGIGAVALLGIVLVVVLVSGGSSPIPNPDDGPEVGKEFGIAEPKFKAVNNRPLIELSKEDNATVEEMVKKGVAFLKQTQGPEGSWGHAGAHDNYVAFGGLTLLECGVPANDPAVQKAAKFARDRLPQQNRTYPVSLFLLFFDRLGDPQDKARIEQLAMRLVAGQTAQGGWGYQVPILPEADTAALRSFMRGVGRNTMEHVRRAQPELFQTLPPQLRNIGLLHTPGGIAGDYFRAGGDNSNTQFALLALWAARRHNLPVDASLELVVRRFRNTQNPDGSFNYSGRSNVAPLPSMTCAGLLGLAVGYGMAQDNRGGGPQQDPGIQKALEHLSKSVGDPAPNAQAPIRMTDMYFLWSTERVAVLYQLKKIIEKDWYHWGYTMLRKNQNPNGSWHAHHGHGSDPFTDTCFALLFLQRVNLAKDLTDKLNELNAAPQVAGNPNVPRKE